MKKKSEGLSDLSRALFLLFRFFSVLFWSFRQAFNLKVTVVTDLYLKFAYAQVACPNQPNGIKIVAIAKIGMNSGK
jgi:hypothetical protein